MSISPTSNYMSNADILSWMELKTEGLYGHLRDSMDIANTRADAESALDDVKAALANSKTNADAARDAINAALAKYPDVPEVAQVLQPIADELSRRYNQASADYGNAVARAQQVPEPADSDSPGFAPAPMPTAPAPVTISSTDIDTWSKQIGDKVDNLGKQDQLGLINIQELNSQLNQAKQTASALLDSADKSASSIINHIG